MKKTVTRITIIFFFVLFLCLGSISYCSEPMNVKAVGSEETLLTKVRYTTVASNEVFCDMQDHTQSNITALIFSHQIGVKAFQRVVTFLIYFITILILMAHMSKMGLQTNAESHGVSHLYVIRYIQSMDGKKKVNL